MKMFLPDLRWQIIFIYVYILIYIIIITNFANTIVESPAVPPLSSRAVQNGRERERDRTMSRGTPGKVMSQYHQISRGVNEIGLQSRIFYT